MSERELGLLRSLSHSLTLSLSHSLTLSLSHTLSHTHRSVRRAVVVRATSPNPSRSSVLRTLSLSAVTVLLSPLSPALPQASYAEFVEPVEVPKLLCDAACEEALGSVERVRLPSGLEFQDIRVGSGPAPPVGYQVVLHYILMTKDGRVISNSLENGTPYDIRVGTGQVVGGLDEGLKTMRVGGVRRIYVPEGELSFPKGLPSAPGRPRVAPGAAVIFDVQLLYVPGLELEDE